jgi:formate dehydrogenase major subunit
LPDGSDTEILHTETFKRGKENSSQQLGKKQLNCLITVKNSHTSSPPIESLEHYNCGTMTRRTNNAQILKEDVLMINPKTQPITTSRMAIWFV